MGTKEKHLSVIDFEKKMRSREVADLEKIIQNKTAIISALDAETEDKKSEITELLEKNGDFKKNLTAKRNNCKKRRKHIKR